MVQAIKTDTKVIRKSPTEVRKFDIEFGGTDMATGEIIDTIVSVTISPVGLVKDTQAISGTKVQLGVSAGTARVLYRVKTTVTTSSPFLQTLVMVGRVLVGDA